MADQALWKGLFEWSMQQQDGTSAPRPMAEQDRQWLETALKSCMIDLGKRLTDIKDALDTSGAESEGGGAAATAAGEGSAGGGEAAGAARASSAAAAGGGATGSGGGSSSSGGSGDGGSVATLEERERLLDELMDIVEQIDLARDLHTIGGLQTLLDLLRSPHPSLRWRAAEVAATCVQNNPPVQKSFLEGGIMPRLLCLLSDADSTVQTKGLLAISCLVRGYPPALVLLREERGLDRLVALLDQNEPRLQRKCLQVLQYMLRVVPLDRRPAAADSGLLPALSATLGSEDNDVREAALAVAQQLAAADDSLRVVQQCAGFRAAVEALLMRLDTLPQDEWAAVQDEVAAAKSLADALQRDLPPEAEEGNEGRHGSALPVAVVDDSTTTGQPAAALQLVAVPAAPAAPAGAQPAN